MAERNTRKGFFARLWDAITQSPGETAPPRTRSVPESPRQSPRQTEYRVQQEYRPTSSGDNERLANKLIRVFERNMDPRYRGRLDENRVRDNVEKMTPEQKANLLPMSDDHILYEMAMGNITDDDGNNLLWYH